MQIKTELLVRRVDKINPDPELNAQLTKRGDVVVVRESPCVWSQKELDNPEWLIIQSDMDLVDAEAFLESEDGFLSGAEADKTKRRRKKFIDLDQANADLPTQAADQAHKATGNFSIPFQFNASMIAQYARDKS